jgi:type II secretory pathway component PulC
MKTNKIIYIAIATFILAIPILLYVHFLPTKGENRTNRLTNTFIDSSFSMHKPNFKTAQAQVASTLVTQQEEVPIPNIVLVGTFIEQGYKNAAIIADKGKQKIFRVDDYIDNYWQLIKVQRNQIVLTDNNRELVIDMKFGGVGTNLPERFPDDSNEAVIIESFSQKMERYLNGRYPSEVAFPDGLELSGIEKIADNGFELDLITIIDQIRKTPLHRQSKYLINEEGIEFVEIVPGSLFDNGGFMPGDIINRIDGRNVTGPEDLDLIYLLSKESVSVELKRENIGINYTYILKK